VARLLLEGSAQSVARWVRARVAMPDVTIGNTQGRGTPERLLHWLLTGQTPASRRGHKASATPTTKALAIRRSFLCMVVAPYSSD